MPLNCVGRNLYWALIVVCFDMVSTASGFAAPQLGTPIDIPGMKGKVIVNDRGAAKIHAYAPSPGASTTHVIETNDGLVVIDAQMTVPDAREAIAYVRSLNKPIRRLIVSHAHPDHWLGLGEWGDVPSASIAEVQNYINGPQGSHLYRAPGGKQPYRALGPQLSEKQGRIISVLPASEKLIGLDFVSGEVAPAKPMCSCS